MYNQATVVMSASSVSYLAALDRIPVSGSTISTSQSINLAYRLLARSKDTCNKGHSTFLIYVIDMQHM